MSRRYTPFSFHVGSANRQSLRSGATSERPAVILCCLAGEAAEPAQRSTALRRGTPHRAADVGQADGPERLGAFDCAGRRFPGVGHQSVSGGRINNARRAGS